MSIKEGVSRVLREHGAPVLDGPTDRQFDVQRVVLEERGDGTATLRLTDADNFADDRLQRYADLCAEAGFVVAMLKDEQGVFMSLS